MATLPHGDLVKLLAEEGIDTDGLATFCASPDGALLYLPVLQTKARALWLHLRRLVQQTGYWPVLRLSYAAMGWPSQAARAESDALAVRSVRDVVKMANHLDVPAWLDAQQVACGLDPDDPDDAEALETLIGAWPDQMPGASDFWILHAEFPSPWLELRLVPTTVPWHVPTFFTYGNGPPPYAHVAILKRWQRHYGAEIVTSAGDTVEMLVKRPPHTRRAAWALAFDHYAYCPDVVEQGSQTIGQLAAHLLDTDTWYFWWD